MGFSLHLDEMSDANKIAIMEEIWDNLCKNPESIPSPEWHAETLKKRELEVREGKASFSDFEKTKEKIRERVK